MRLVNITARNNDTIKSKVLENFTETLYIELFIRQPSTRIFKKQKISN